VRAGDEGAVVVEAVCGFRTLSPGVVELAAGWRRPSLFVIGRHNLSERTGAIIDEEVVVVVADAPVTRSSSSRRTATGLTGSPCSSARNSTASTSGKSSTWRRSWAIGSSGGGSLLDARSLAAARDC
jgi:hypothetical protein